MPAPPQSMPPVVHGDQQSSLFSLDGINGHEGRACLPFDAALSVDPPGSTLDAYYRAELKEIVYIYTLLFPGAQLRIVLSKTDDPYFGRPIIMHGQRPIAEAAYSDDLLGVYDIRGSGEAGPQWVTIFVSIPRPPTRPEINDSHHQWTPNGRLRRAMFSVWPMSLDLVRHYVEERLRIRQRHAHRWKPLFRSRTNFAAPTGNSARPPAIILALHWLEIGGAEKFALDCVRHAKAAGMRVFVVADVPAFQRLKAKLPAETESVRFIRLDRYLNRHDWSVFLENLVRTENVRLLHIHHCSSAYDSLSHLKAVFPHLRTIDTTHIIEYSDGGYPRTSGVWSRFIDVRHVISDDLKRFFSEEFHSTEGVIVGRLLEARDESPTRRLAGGDGPFTICFVGRLCHQKRPLLAIQVFENVHRWARKNNVSTRFVMVGDGEYRGVCEAVLRRRRDPPNVTFLPGNTDVAAVLNSAHVLLLPSANEGLALVCYEAVAHGVVPISSAVGAQGELLPPELLVDKHPARCVTQMTDIVKGLICDRNFRELAWAGLCERYKAIASEPSAEQVIRGIYRASVGQRDGHGF